MDRPKFYYLSVKFLREPIKKEISKEIIDKALSNIEKEVNSIDPWKCSAEEIKQLKKAIKGGLK